MVLGQKKYKENDGRPCQYQHTKFDFNNFRRFEVIPIKLSVTDKQARMLFFPCTGAESSRFSPYGQRSFHNLLGGGGVNNEWY